MLKKPNLWNLNNRKTRNVIEYIQNIEYDDTTPEKILAFEQVREKALSKNTPDKMLKTIGYKVRGRDNIHKITD